MTRAVPRIQTATAVGPTALAVRWRGGPSDRIDLAGWIRSGGHTLAPLSDPAIFRAPRVGEHGSAVVWGDDAGDLAIDAAHLDLLAREQRPFRSEDAAAWQSAMGFSNQEAADFLKIGLSTWNSYKAGSAVIPEIIAVLCRAAERDPLLVHAHFKPRKTGRPRRTV